MKLLGKRLIKVLGNAGLDQNKEASALAHWYAEQERKLRSGEEIEPPWIAFPDSSPVHGWNQGYEEAWKLNVWTPFWRRMCAEEQHAYLEKWPPPVDDWLETLKTYWPK